MSTIVEACIMGFPIFLVMRLEMKTHMKTRVILSFALRAL